MEVSAAQRPIACSVITTPVGVSLALEGAFMQAPRDLRLSRFRFARPNPSLTPCCIA